MNTRALQALPFAVAAPWIWWLFSEPDRLFTALFVAASWLVSHVVVTRPGMVFVLFSAASVAWRALARRAASPTVCFRDRGHAEVSAA